MFTTHAHTFVLQARLAISLAWIAGYVNILTFITCGAMTSHVSGTASLLGKDVAEGRLTLGLYAAFLLAMFFAGTLISGTCTEVGHRRGWNSIYVLPISIESLLLIIFSVGIFFHNPQQLETHAALYWISGSACAAMGLQNATITRISSGVVRTTHVTGVLTDTGLELIQYLFWVRDKRRDVPPGSVVSLLRGLKTHPSVLRLALLASILGSFTLGALLGTLAYGYFPAASMAPPVLFLLWLLYQDISRPIAEIEPLVVVNGSNEPGWPVALAVFHLQQPHAQSRRIHRMPNFTAWADRLPARYKVVVLDLAGSFDVSNNTVIELKSIIARLHAQGRHLIIAGLTTDQCRFVLRDGSLSIAHLCPDMELAIARAMLWLEDAASPPAGLGGVTA